MNGRNYSHMNSWFEESATFNMDSLKNMMGQAGFSSWTNAFESSVPSQQQRHQSYRKEGQLEQIRHIVRSFGAQLGEHPEQHIKELVQLGIKRDDADTLLMAALQEYIQRSRDEGRSDDDEHASTQEPGGIATTMIIRRESQTERSKEYTTTFTTWGD